MAGCEQDWPLSNDELTGYLEELQFYSRAVRRGGPATPNPGTQNPGTQKPDTPKPDIPIDRFGVTEWSMGMLIIDEPNELAWGVECWVA
jgi:hypothetical protein